MDPELVEKIVHEVKSQGVFDEFRKDSMADVDTKPAYQNLRQRVENSVKKFLQDQRWTPETNKHQLRERLRRHITESGFLDVGVNLVVDQVVNPKIGSVFQPRIEDIAYKYLGIPQPPPYVKFEPPPPPLHPFPPLPLNGPPQSLQIETGTVSLLPTDLEQVSPDSDKATIKSELKDESMVGMDLDEKAEDDDESPPFEPLGKAASPLTIIKKEEGDSEKCASPASAPPLPASTEEAASSVQSIGNRGQTQEADEEATQDTTRSTRTAEFDSEKEASRSFDAAATQESQLSQVSSDSQLSSHDVSENNGDSSKRDAGLETAAACNISEEAQMPKFNENSSEQKNGGEAGVATQLHFDIKKDEIKFEGTERKSNLVPIEAGAQQRSDELPEEGGAVEKQLEESRADSGDVDVSDSFKFGKLRVETELAEAQIGSLVSSHDDSSSTHLVIVEKIKDETDHNSSTMPAQPEKEDAKHNSSSSSRHKHKRHYSKEKLRSHDRDRDKERGEKEKDKHRSREHDRSKERHHNRSGKHSSASSKHSSSTATTPRQTDAPTNSKSASDKAAAKHSSSSNSSSSRAESDAKRAPTGDRRSESNDNKSAAKHHSSSVSKRKTTKKDDHNESKEKLLHRRKSTDSNDEDKYAAPPLAPPNASVVSATATAGIKAPTTTKAKHTNGTNGANGTQHATTALSANAPDQQQQHRNKVVLLNDILQNPGTDFIELEANKMQVIVTMTAKASSLNNEISSAANQPATDVATAPEITSPHKSDDDSELYFFEETDNDQFVTRLALLNEAMDAFRRLRLETLAVSVEAMEVEEVTPAVAPSAADGRPKRLAMKVSGQEGDDHRLNASNNEKAPAEDDLAVPTKRYKPSPTPSEANSSSSGGSKENEAVDKNAVAVAAKQLPANHIPVNHDKLNQQQRYTSEDLYKPRRPIVLRQQRCSKRRLAIDSL